MADITLKKISELGSIENINNNDLILISQQDDTDTFISKKIDFNALSTNILSSTETKINSLSNIIHDSVVRFSDYPTESKAGVVRVGTGLTLSSNGSINVISVDVGVKTISNGANITIDDDNNGNYTISANVGVKTISNGANITIDDDNNGNYTISANVGVKTIDGRTPDNYGNVDLDNIRSLIPNAVDISAVYSFGTKIAQLSIGNDIKPIYIPNKDTITVSPYYDTGINLGEIKINQQPFNIFMPTNHEPTYTLLVGSTKFGQEIKNPGSFTANTSWCNTTINITTTQTLVGSEYNWTYLDNGMADILYTNGGVRYYWQLTEPWTSFDTLLVEFSQNAYPYYPGSHRLDVKYLIRLAQQLQTAYPYDILKPTTYKNQRSINLIGDSPYGSEYWRIELVASYLAGDRLYNISENSCLHAIYGLRN